MSEDYRLAPDIPSRDAYLATIPDFRLTYDSESGSSTWTHYDPQSGNYENAERQPGDNIPFGSLVDRLYAEAFERDAIYGRYRYGTRGKGCGPGAGVAPIPFDKTDHGLVYVRTGRPWEELRDNGYADSVSKVPVQYRNLPYDPEYGYWELGALAAAVDQYFQSHYQDHGIFSQPSFFFGLALSMFGGIVFSAAGGLSGIFDSLSGGLAETWAGTAVETVVEDVTASVVDTGATIGGSVDDIFGDLSDYSGWQEGDIYTFDGSEGDAWSTTTTTDVTPTDADYTFHDTYDAYGGSTEGWPVDSTVSPPQSSVMTPDRILAADIDDAELGDAMRKAAQAVKSGGGFDWAKLFKDGAGTLYKLVTKSGPGGGTRVVPQQVRLPNGAYASVNAAGQLVASTTRTTLPFTLTTSQLTQWALPLAIGAGALLLFSRSRA